MAFTNWGRRRIGGHQANAAQTTADRKRARWEKKKYASNGTARAVSFVSTVLKVYVDDVDDVNVDVDVDVDVDGMGWDVVSGCSPVSVLCQRAGWRAADLATLFLVL